MSPPSCPPTNAGRVQPARPDPALGLWPALVPRQPALLPRVALYTAQLRALPRRVRRALQRQWRGPLVGIALLLALGQLPVQAATIPVSDTCRLIDAITAANTDTATGGCPAGSGPDTIVLPPGSTQTLTEVNNDTYGPTGLPVVSSVITIAGQGSTITRASEAPEFRLLAVSSTGDLTLQETTVSGGYLSSPNDFGGGIANYGGTLTITNSTLSGNIASGGGGISNGYSANYYGGTLTVLNSTLAGNTGGGILNFRGTLTVTNSTLAGNTGGGIRGILSTVTVTNSTLTGNAGVGIDNDGTLTVLNSTLTGNAGGGISNGNGALTVANSTLTGNFGSGILNFRGALTVANSTIAGNTGRFRGGGIDNFGGTVTITNSTLSGNFSYGDSGGIANYGGTLTITNSTLSGNLAHFSGGGISNNGLLTVLNSTISDNFSLDIAGSGGGILNSYGALTVTNSTLSGNYAPAGGGIASFGYVPLTITNSTLTGNIAGRSGGGIVNGGGPLTITNSTLTGNTVASNDPDPYFGGGGVANFGPLTLVRTVVAGNTARTGPEIRNSGTVLTDNHNLFGVNGNAGVEGFTPDATDVVPRAGVQLRDILTPSLAFHGGPTQTQALVPGSPAIDAGGTTCPDANGAPLLTDQRGRPRVVDGNGDGTAACDIGAFEFFPLVNAFVTLEAAPDTALDRTPVPDGPAGTFTITATFTNTSDTPLRFPFFTVTDLSGDNLLLNAVEGVMGVGGTVTPDVGDDAFSPGETVAVDFVIGLHTPARFTFFVDLFGEPLP